MMLELATPRWSTFKRSNLVWAGARPNVVQDFTSKNIEAITEKIATFVAENRVNAVLAPTHFLETGFKDPWLEIDRRLTLSLRRHLDSNGGAETVIFYPLATSTQIFREIPQRTV